MPSIPKTLSIVSYAVNGRGVGHLSRLIAVNRWIRRYAIFAGTRTRHWFLTTSEADTMLHREGFAGFKLPSKSVIEEAGVAKPDYLALAKQWVWHSIALLRPDILLVDTFPNGSFQELLGVLDLVGRKVLILRPVRADYSRRGAFRAVAGLYDRIIVPEDAGERSDVAAQLGLDAGLVRACGPIVRGEPFEALGRHEARSRLGVPAEARCILVSGGGGGDQTVDRLFDRACRILAAEEGTWLVLAAGPLYRGPRRGGPRTIWWSTPDLYEYMSAFDGAVCAGGFNTVHELLQHGVPTVFVPQDKVADDQDGRIRRLVDRGAALLGRLDDGSLELALRTVSDPTASDQLARAARATCETDGARRAGAAVLEASLPAGVLARAREEVDDDALGAIRRLGASLDELVDLCVCFAEATAEADRERLELSPALDVLVRTSALGLLPAMTTRLARQFVRRFKRPIQPEQGALVDAFVALLEAPPVRGQWSALSMLLGALVAERSMAPDALSQALVSLIDHALNRGIDVLGVARLVLDQAQTFDGRSNGTLIEAVRDAWPAAAPGGTG